MVRRLVQYLMQERKGMIAEWNKERIAEMQAQTSIVTSPVRSSFVDSAASILLHDIMSSCLSQGGTLR